MRYDANMRLSNQQAITTTAYSTDRYSLRSYHDLSSGSPYLLDCHVDQTFAGGTSLQIEAIGHFTTDVATEVALGAVIYLGSSETMALAANFLVAGADIQVALNPAPQAKLDLMESLGVFGGGGLNISPPPPGYLYITARYTVSGTMTAGKLTTHIVPYTMSKRRRSASRISF